jgi:predicted RNA-binding protein with PUA-like domain
MLEKDIENLLAKYSNEFLPNRNLKLVGQQVKLGTYFADVVFENPKGEMVIIEIKRGLLRREAIGQIIEYYGMLKQKEPNRNIILYLVANVIPKEMTIFLKEKLGIEFIEISASKIREVAEKHSYKFLDAEKPELLRESKEVLEKFDAQAYSGKSVAWVFQSNPQRYDILNAVADKELIEDVWEVKRYKDEVRLGNVCLVWMSGKESGIYAVGDIISNIEPMKESAVSAKYWVQDEDRYRLRPRVKIKYVLRLTNNPIMREELKNIPKLRKMEIIEQPHAMNPFRVTSDEWEIILDILKKRYGLEY